jgi:hypothetical protein
MMISDRSLNRASGMSGVNRFHLSSLHPRSTMGESLDLRAHA